MDLSSERIPETPLPLMHLFIRSIPLSLMHLNELRLTSLLYVISTTLRTSIASLDAVNEDIADWSSVVARVGKKPELVVHAT